MFCIESSPKKRSLPVRRPVRSPRARPGSHTMPPPTLPGTPTSADIEHLNLLVLFHYIVAGLGALGACLPIFHVIMGVMIVNGRFPMAGPAQTATPPPEFVGYMFIGLGVFFILSGWALAFCAFLSGRFIKRREKRIFSFVVAGLLCVFFPFGTALGVFSFVVLSRDSVKRIYREPGTSLV